MGNVAIDINEDRFEEIYRVIDSFFYFVKNYVWIEDKISGMAIPFKLWASQERILHDFLESPRLVILKARQLGLTWLTACYALWLCITRSLQLVVVISAKEEWAIEFLDRVKFVLRRLPEWLYPRIEKETGQELTFNAGDNLLSTIKSLATTPEGAQSKTPTLLVLDETARNRYIKQIWAASKPGIDAAKGRIILISNSIKDGVGWSWTRDIYTKSMRGENDFKRIFMPWNDQPDRPENFIQLQISQGMDEDDASQHYPATEQEAISTLLGSYFGKVLKRHSECAVPGIIGRLKRNSYQEVVFERDDKGPIELWRYPYNLLVDYDGLPWSKRYAIGSDVSEGLGQSYSVGYVVDRLSDEMVCRIRSNRIDAYQWAEQLNLLHEYYDRALVCVERTGAGQTTVKRLSEINANQYVQLVPDVRGSQLTRKYGWGESNQSKHELSGDLKQWFRATDGGFYCSYLLDEASTWIRHENGKIGPEEGKLGDCVIAAGLTIQASLYLGEKPEKAEPPTTGWMKRWKQGEL